MKYFGAGLITKKLLLPFLLALTQILIDLSEQYYKSASKKCNVDQECLQSFTTLNTFTIAISQMSLLFLNKKSISGKSEENNTKKNVIRFF